MSSIIQKMISDRLGGESFFTDTTIYKFEKIKRAKKKAMELNPNVPIIDMGIGEPDAPAAHSICDVLNREAPKSENRFYSDNGIIEFQEAAAAFMKNCFNVGDLIADSEIVHGIGSKPIFPIIALAFINPGDYLITTVPGYPVLGTYTKYLGGNVFSLPLRESNNFYPDFSEIPDQILKKAKLLYVNYPNNPTGQIATKELFDTIIEFGLKNNILIVHDAAYAGLVYDSNERRCILNSDGAKEIALEVHSLSKSFNMTGWRLGFVAGNRFAVKAYAAVKDNTDSGQFRAIQKAGAFALSDLSLLDANCMKYSRRMNKLCEIFERLGCKFSRPRGTFYLYIKAPKGVQNGITFESAEMATDYILINSSISTVPWDDAGSYLRFTVTFEADSEAEEITILSEIESRLQQLNLIWE